MAIKTVRIGSMDDIHQYDDGDFDAAIETDGVIKTTQAPVVGDDVLRKDDIPGFDGDVIGPAASTDNEVPVFDGVTGKLIKAGTGLIITANLMQAADKAVLLSGTTGGTPASGAGTRMMWIPAKGAFRTGQVTGNQWDDANIGNYSFVGGMDNKASNHATAVLSGFNNRAESLYSAIITGQGNAITGWGMYSAIAGGFNNAISMRYSGILSGFNCSITGQASGVITGQRNVISGHFSTIFGGTDNEIASSYSVVGGKYMQLGAAAANSFAWGYHTSAIALTQPNTFYIFPDGTAGKVAIGTTTPAPSAIMDLTSTIGALILPRMTTAQKNALTAVNGMLIYDLTLNQTQTYENGAWRQI